MIGRRKWRSCYVRERTRTTPENITEIFLACATIKSIVGFKFNIPVHPKSSYMENYMANYTWVTLLNKFLLVEAANIAHYHLSRSLLLCACIALVAMLFSDLTDF